MAARQALRLCEAELFRPTWDTPDVPQSGGGIRNGQPRISAAMARAALRAGCRRTSPPHSAVGCA
jgi:hypothetical protein